MALSTCEETDEKGGAFRRPGESYYPDRPGFRFVLNIGSQVQSAQQHQREGKMAPAVGLEATTRGLQAAALPTELCRNT